MTINELRSSLVQQRSAFEVWGGTMLLHMSFLELYVIVASHVFIIIVHGGGVKGQRGGWSGNGGLRDIA